MANFNAKIDEVDKLTPSPSARASKIYALISPKDNGLTNWDLICFCVEYLGSQSIVYDWLKAQTMPLVRIVYRVHYEFGKEIGLYGENEDSPEDKAGK